MVEPQYFTEFKNLILERFEKIDSQIDFLAHRSFSLESKMDLGFERCERRHRQILGVIADKLGTVKDLQDENVVSAYRQRVIQDQLDQHDRDISAIKQVVFPPTATAA